MTGPEREEMIFQARSNFLASASILADEYQIRMRVELEAKDLPDLPDPDFDGVTDAIDLVRRRLEEVKASGEVTEGDADLSRAAHVDRAAEQLDRVWRLIGALSGADFGTRDDGPESGRASEDVLRHLQAAVSETFFAAFGAGQHAQLAIGKDNEAAFVTLSDRKQQNRDNARKGGRREEKDMRYEALDRRFLEDTAFWSKPRAQQLKLLRRYVDEFDEKADPRMFVNKRDGILRQLSDAWFRKYLEERSSVSPLD